MPDAGREIIEIRPQPGPQTQFLSTPADIAIYGGAAGGGKSWALLLEPLRHKDKKNFGGVVFRWELTQVTNEGGLWDESSEIYGGLAKSNASYHYWTFPSGARMSFRGVQHEAGVRKFQGSQIPYLGLDELTHFPESVFWYLVSRNRSARAGIRSYVRATCNPDPDSWVRQFIDWWVDDEGFAIKERAGVIRWLVRDNGQNHWYDSKDDAADAWPEYVDKFGDEFCKSVTFIPADIFDNPALLSNDPGYLANLLALPLVEREQLLKGNWNVKATAGKVYNRTWFEIVDADRLGRGGIDVRFWDLASTEKKTKGDDPDYTATVKMRYKNDVWTVIDAYQIQTAAANVEKLVFQVAELDKREAKRNGTRYKLRWEREPGSASKRESMRWTLALRGIDAKGVLATEDKLSRARACSVQAESGNIKLLRADWNAMLLTNLHGFPDLPHDDLFDATSGAFTATLEGSKAVGD